MNRLTTCMVFLFIVLCRTPTKGQIIFETDFSQDTGYFITNQSLVSLDNVPTGWDGAKVTGNGSFAVIENAGVGNNKNALKIDWDPNVAQPTNQLWKHLTGDVNTGYEELYIRYHVRLPDSFKAGKDSSLPYWKWGRLWQNTETFPAGGTGNNTWTENRDDSYYYVWNFAGNPNSSGIDVNLTVGANTGNLSAGSSGGDRYKADYFLSGPTSVAPSRPGYFEAMGGGAWDLDNDNADTRVLRTFTAGESQEWHTIEYRAKLATTATSNDGIWEMWFDGVYQQYINPSDQEQNFRLEAKGGAPALPQGSGLPTAKNGSGFNMFIFFDNLARWNDSWGEPGVEGGIYVNDVVISTQPIGRDYIVGSAPPAGPGDFDEDGDVDGNDFLVWQRGGSSNGATVGDLMEWETNFGTASIAVLANVPEPTSGLLFLMGANVLLGRRRR